MKNFRNVMLALFMLGMFAPASQLTAAPVLLDFEDLEDLASVDDNYASYGLHFINAISLTTGFSVNEFDYPSHSGEMVIGDDRGPIVIIFDNPTSEISAYFTYASTLTITAYDVFNTVLGTFTTLTDFNLGVSEYILLDFSNVSSLVIAGFLPDSFIMDDFSFDSATSVPEPSTLLLFSGGLAGLASAGRRNRSAKNPERCVQQNQQAQ
jgi:hypothetical protein